MRYALVLGGIVLLIGMAADKFFSAQVVQPAAVPVPDGTQSRPSSPYWVSRQEDRQRSTPRANRYMVTNEHDGGSSTRRGLPPTGTIEYRTRLPQ